MKLKDSTCGGIPQVTENFDDYIEFVVSCTACGNQTPSCKILMRPFLYGIKFIVARCHRMNLN
jgi:hypothetical protein